MLDIGRIVQIADVNTKHPGRLPSRAFSRHFNGWRESWYNSLHPPTEPLLQI
jgi:hypothetical protein